MDELPPEGAPPSADVLDLDIYRERFVPVGADRTIGGKPRPEQPNDLGVVVNWPKPETVPEREWLIPGVIPLGRLGLLTGEGGMGKSRLGLQIAGALASGDDEWLPGTSIESSTDKHRVVYVTYEDEQDEISRRIKDIGFDDPQGMFANRFHRLHANVGELWGPNTEGSQHTSTLGTERPAMQKLKQHCIDTEASFLIIDPLGGAFLSNENDRGLVTQFCYALDQWGQEHGVTIMLIAHPPKSGGAYSGSTAWRGSVRWLLHAHRAILVPGDKKLGIKEERWPCLMVDKSNYGIEHSRPVWWFTTDRTRGMALHGKASVVSADIAKGILETNKKDQRNEPPPHEDGEFNDF